MKAFLDTSALFKKYVDETGSEKLYDLLSEVDEILVSPITKIELFSALDRRLQEKSIEPLQIKTISHEIVTDMAFFSSIFWNSELEEKTIKYVQKYHLKAFDALQLSSGHFSSCDIFVTSDKILAKAAQKELTKVVLI
jgi:predicted nucleic acid-binding protein